MTDREPAARTGLITRPWGGFALAHIRESTNPRASAFDVLQLNGEELLMARPYSERRARLEALFADRELTAPWTLCPMTRDREVAAEWLRDWTEVPGIEGVVLKPVAGRYTPGSRQGGWVKIRRRETTEAIFPVKFLCSALQAESVELRTARRRRRVCASPRVTHEPRKVRGGQGWTVPAMTFQFNGMLLRAAHNQRMVSVQAANFSDAMAVSVDIEPSRLPSNHVVPHTARSESRNEKRADDKPSALWSATPRGVVSPCGLPDRPVAKLACRGALPVRRGSW
ncbi:hypothetical protein [Streptomyces sp. NPDC058155]|uniref:ATP-dependent DNA ligase n=1 Tax=Streptomyces sp. NPDC058155 TaxID=3346359 RepID=UPI0036E09350